MSSSLFDQFGMIRFRMGTARPTLYHVLHDDNKFNSDDIQQLTYWVSREIFHCLLERK